MPRRKIPGPFLPRPPYAGLDAGDPDTILDVLKAIGQHTRPLQVWLALQGYITHTFTKFGLDLEPLKRYAADLVAPFENNGDPLPGWYRAATQRVPGVRIVFSNEEAGLAEALPSATSKPTCWAFTTSSVRT